MTHHLPLPRPATHRHPSPKGVEKNKMIVPLLSVPNRVFPRALILFPLFHDLNRSTMLPRILLQALSISARRSRSVLLPRQSHPMTVNQCVTLPLLLPTMQVSLEQPTPTGSVCSATLYQPNHSRVTQSPTPVTTPPDSDITAPKLQATATVRSCSLHHK
jgi:hypothetical protein